jgi:hypothetical protein
MRSGWAPPLVTAGCVSCACTTTSTDDASSGSGGATEGRACELAVVAGPTWLNDALGELPGGSFGMLGLLATPGGLLAVFSRHEGGEAERFDRLFAARFDHERRPQGTAVEIDAMGGATWSAGPEFMVRAHCSDFAIDWSLVDVTGQTVAELPPPGDLGCAAAPAVAWLGTTRFLAAWLSRDGGAPNNSGCPEPGSCVALALVDDGVVSVARPLFDDGANGPTPSVTIAASDDAAVVAQLRWSQDESTNEIVAMLVDHAGTTLGSEVVIEMPESTPDDRFLSLAAIAEPDGGFAIYLGGYGPSMARTRLDRDGAVVEPFTELPLFHEVGVFGVYRRDFGLFPWRDGAIAFGSAVDGGLTNGLLTGLDVAGAPIGHIPLAGMERALAGVDDRTWLLDADASGRLYLSELGCVDQ